MLMKKIVRLQVSALEYFYSNMKKHIIGCQSIYSFSFAWATIVANIIKEMATHKTKYV
jgi:hypothetical protein